MAIIRKLSRRLVEKEPYHVWNSCIEVVALHPYEELNEVQRLAHLCFWYDSQVQNGGHLQYFENRGTGRVAETISALISLGGKCQAAILELAASRFTSRPRVKPDRAEEYVKLALAGTYNEFDSAFHRCEPTIHMLLDKYFECNRDHFVTLT